MAVQLLGVVMQSFCRAWPCFVAVVVSLAAGFASAQATALRAPNVVEISPLLVTSGQPSAAGLAGLAALGFEVTVPHWHQKVELD